MLHDLLVRAPQAAEDEDPLGRYLAATWEVTTHAGEFLQGKFNTENDAPLRALITLRCSAFRTTVTARRRPDGEIRTVPPGRSKAEKAARLTLAFLGLADQGVTLKIESDVPEGIGAGSSTGDVVATINAVAATFRRHISPERVAHLAIEAEVACDPLMYDPRIPRLFAQRAGVTLEVFAGGLPPLDIVSIADGETVDTLAHPPADYTDPQIYDFDNLRTAFRLGIEQKSAARIGAVATRSAEVNQSHLRKPGFKLWHRLAEHHGAVGLAVAHSGSIVNFIFDGADDLRHERMKELVSELRYAGVKLLAQHRVGHD